MLKRKIYPRLLEWKKNHSHTCLMIKGARQVGKTFIVREFGVNEYRSFIEINFIKQKELKDIFSGPLDAATIYKKEPCSIIRLREMQKAAFMRILSQNAW